MNIRVAHGSKKNNLSHLIPHYYEGNNGSQDGIGVNLTSDIQLACNYAKSEGSIYLVDLNVNNFLTISDKAYLTKEQAMTLADTIESLSEPVKTRLATDICGKISKSFEDENLAEAFYKKERAAIKELNINLDRMKPEIDYDKGGVTIRFAHKDMSSLTSVSTSHIHRCLNLYDNGIATVLLKEISDGLVLERESGLSNYLSFRKSEKVVVELGCEMLAKPNVIDLIESSCRKYSSGNIEKESVMGLGYY